MPKIQINLESGTYTKEQLEDFILTFAKATGYTEQTEGTPLDYVKIPIGRYFRETIVAYQSFQAMEQTRAQVVIATDTALDTIVLTVGVEA